MKYVFIALTTAALLSHSQAALAQHEHSDVEFGYEGGELVIEGGPIFEGDFGDAEHGNDGTADPGFENAADEFLTIGANEFLGYHVVRPLLYHNGSDFASSGATLNIENVATTSVNVSETVFEGWDFIDQADGSGNLHEHLIFTISPTAPVGAYGLYLTLETFDDQMNPTGVPASEPLLIVFNRGLDETTFEDVAVPAFATTIPEPTCITLLGASMVGLMMRRKR